ncbi:MAG: rhomboid family intramembrane serine protease [Chitinophagales bacterium]
MSVYGNNSIIDDIRHEFRYGNVVNKLILINVAVFLAVRLLHLVMYLATNTSLGEFENDYVTWLMVPSNLKDFLWQPWSIITYMFLQTSFMHILMNMIVLYVFGKLLLGFLGDRQVFPIYVLGGIAGALLYMLVFNLSPAFQSISGTHMLGASAGVMAVMLAMCAMQPNYQVMLFFIGAVQVKYIAAVFILMDLLNISQENPGGHIAHLGGALFGFFYIKQLQKGKDWGDGLNRLMDFLATVFKPGPKKPKVVYRNEKKQEQTRAANNGKVSKQKTMDPLVQAKIDTILDKISESGYNSLTKEEREFLFKAKDGE